MESYAFQSESVRPEGIAFSIKSSNSKIKLIKTFWNWIIHFSKVLLGNPEIRIQKSPGVSISREEELRSIQERSYAEGFFKI
jgi:hypothetical protein